MKFTQQVREKYAHLEDELVKLSKFIYNDPGVETLDAHEKNLLVLLSDSMHQHKLILGMWLDKYQRDEAMNAGAEPSALQKVLKRQKDLDREILEVEVLLENPELPETERIRLKEQYTTMCKYYESLVESFPPVSPEPT